MYGPAPDPYCYPGSTVLMNRANQRAQEALDAFEAAMVTQRLDEPLPAGRLSYSHYRAVHRHIFGDVYAWAGRIRTVRIGKGNSMFCYPEHIDGEMRRLFAQLRKEDLLHNLDARSFANKAAHFIAELNAIHPFREGNGRTQLAFLAVMGQASGHDLNFERMEPERMLTAVIQSFTGDEGALADTIHGLIET